jgi:hypothetical protein
MAARAIVIRVRAPGRRWCAGEGGVCFAAVMRMVVGMPMRDES